MFLVANQIKGDRYPLPAPKTIGKNMSIKDIVAKGNKVNFVMYRKGDLWYSVSYLENDEKKELIFPVPVADTEDATFYPSDKAILFMRYITKHLEG